LLDLYDLPFPLSPTVPTLSLSSTSFSCESVTESALTSHPTLILVIFTFFFISHPLLHALRPRSDARPSGYPDGSKRDDKRHRAGAISLQRDHSRACVRPLGRGGAREALHPARNQRAFRQVSPPAGMEVQLLHSLLLVPIGHSRRGSALRDYSAIASQSIWDFFAIILQSICSRFAIAWDYSAIALRSICDHSAIDWALQPICDYSATALQSICDYSATALQSICDYFAIALQSICDFFAVALQSICDFFAVALQLLVITPQSIGLCNRFVITPQPLCNRFVISLQSLCNRFVISLQSLRNRFVITPQSLCNRFVISLQSLYMGSKKAVSGALIRRNRRYRFPQLHKPMNKLNIWVARLGSKCQQEQGVARNTERASVELTA
jgi:hypothetical protein